MRTSLTILAFAALVASGAIATAQQGRMDHIRAEEGERIVPTLVVTGEADLEVEPDELRLTLSVVSEGDAEDSLQDLMEENNKRIDSVMRALTDLGVEESDIETSRFSVYPRYSNPGRNRAREIMGYRVENEILVETPLLDRAGRLVQAGIDAGANRVASVSFGLRDERAHRARAIRSATQNARADAEALATAAEVALLRPLSIELDQPQVTPFRPMLQQSMERAAVAADAGGGSAAPAITPGRIRVRASVTMRYEIGSRAERD